jgi:triacylglycerol esterase/lipase EstA (alpha/beta hydrolase family)
VVAGTGAREALFCMRRQNEAAALVLSHSTRSVPLYVLESSSRPTGRRWNSPRSTEEVFMSTERRVFLAGLATLGGSALVGISDATAAGPKPRRVLLAHGLLGFSKIGSIPYFNGVDACFDAGSLLMRPNVAPAGSIKDRARQLEKAITDAIPKEGDRRKAIHIVAHSMGGLDARYLISSNGLKRASWIASVTTISTPNWGSPIADLVTGERQLHLTDLDGLASLPADTIVSILESLSKPAPAGVPLGVFAPRAVFDAMKDMRGYFTRIFGTSPVAFAELTSKSTKAFNALHPSLEGVPLLSYAGISRPSQTMCRSLFAPWAVIRKIAGDNDGMVAVSSSNIGDQPRTVAADHLEEVGLGSLFDGVPARKHFPVCDLYREINAWQKNHSPG